MVSLDGIEFLVLTGAGAIIGTIIAVLVALLSIFFPSLIYFVFLPPVIGTFVGFFSAFFVK